MKQKILPAIPVFMAIGFLYLISRQVDPSTIREWTESAGALGPLIIIVLGVLTTVVAPLSGTPILFVGFALYGPNIVFLSSASSLISAAINFYISRRWGRPFVKKVVGEKSLKTVDRFTKNHGVLSLFLLRVFMGSLNDYVSYAMGLTSMRFKTYYIVSLIGAAPSLLIWYFIALNSDSALSFVLFTTVFVGAFTAVFLALKLAEKIIKSTRLTSGA